MRRGRGLVPNRARQREWQDRSRQAQALDVDERAVRDAVFARDGHRCRLRDHVGTILRFDDWEVDVPDCFGGLSYHHRRKAGAAGAYTEANGATLCIGHNRWVEDAPDAAASLDPFLIVRESDPEWESLGKRAARYS